MKKLLLLVATLLFSEIPLVEATGPGNAVATATNSATFDSVSFGTNLNGYTEDGLLISVAALAFSEWSPARSGFSGGFHYPNGGVYAISEISLLDGMIFRQSNLTSPVAGLCDQLSSPGA